MLQDMEAPTDNPSAGFETISMRAAVVAGRIAWQRHALQRMVEREIQRSSVKSVLLSGDLIEDYPGARPFSSALFLGWEGHRPLHVVVAFDGISRQTFIITVYEPTLARFEPGFRKRRRT